MFGQKNWLIILVTQNALHLLGEGDSHVQILPLPTTIVNNLELLNKDALYTLITDWTKQKTYANTKISWILARELCFTLNITQSDPAKLDSEILQFLDTVPFENVISHNYLTPEGRQVVATNKDLVTALIQGFALHGYTTQTVLPASIIPLDELTSETGKVVVRRANELERESLLTPVLVKANPVEASVEEASHQGVDPSKPKSYLPLLLVTFGVLVAILLIVIYLNQ